MTYQEAAAYVARQPGTPADRETAIRRAMARGQTSTSTSAGRVHAPRPVADPAAALAAAGRVVARLAAVRERQALAANRNARLAR